LQLKKFWAQQKSFKKKVGCKEINGTERKNEIKPDTIKSPKVRKK
jgi:hypothetical protein